MPEPGSGRALVERAESGTELAPEEVTEGQVLDREVEPRRVASKADRGASRVGEMLANRYRLERLVAKGGMGRVYLATQLPLERKVAIKLLVSKAYDEEFRARFFLEASTCARLVHRHIVTVHDYGEAENGELFMAMEYLDGEPLSKVISRQIRLEPDRACQIALQVCRALRTAHKAGIVHRDLKPGNVMLLRDEDQESADFVKVLDFGLVKAFENDEGEPAVDLTRSGTWLGSPRYMAPEQIRCKGVDPRTDIYSLGVILFHMVAGRPPFVGSNSVEILEQHLRDPVPNIRELVGDVHYPPELEEVIRTCMQKKQADRYQSMDDVIIDLKAAYRISTGVSIHTESLSLPHEFGTEAEADSNSRGGPTPRTRGETALSRPPPVPALGPAPDLSQPPTPAAPPVSGAKAPPPPPADSSSGQGMISGEPTPWPKPAEPVQRRRTGLWVALALLLVLLSGFAVTRMLAQPKKRIAAPAPAPTPIQLTVRSTPAGAEVVSTDGKVLGTTPLVERVPAAARGTTRTYTLRLEGYADSRVEARLDSEQVMVQASLQQKQAPLVAPPPAPAPTRVAPRPEPARAQPRGEPSRTERRRAAPRPRPRPSPRRAARPTPPPEPEASPSKAEPAAPEPVAPPPPAVGTVDESGGGLVVDEGDGTTVKDQKIPIVD